MMAMHLLSRCLPLSVLFVLSALVYAQAEPRASVQTVLSTQGIPAGQRAVLAIVLDIKLGFHAQSNTPLSKDSVKTEVALTPNPAIKLYPFVYPPGQAVEYPALGKLSVYSGRAVIYVPIEVKPDAATGPLKLTGDITYQICDDKSCFFPEKTPFMVQTTILPAGTTPQLQQPDLFKAFDPAAFSRSSESHPASRPAPPPLLAGPAAQTWSIAYAFAVAFLAGILFNVMPCVLPVMPLKAIGFYEVSQHHRDKCVLLGLVFSAGVIAFFAAVALVILVFKSLTWGQQFSNPYFLWGIVGILVVMALGMFGAFTFNLPTTLYSFTPRHDTYTGNFLFGIFTAVLSTPCTAPLFPPLMLWAHAQPIAVGIPAVMMVGVGMAAPYLVLSAFPGLARNFPRTGPWSELVKQMMGFLLLAAAAYFGAGQLIEGSSFWWAVLAVVAVACLFLVTRTAQLTKGALAVGISSTLAVAMFGAVLWQAVGVGHGSWVPYSTQALEDARKQNKIVLVKFTANWCANCQVVESTVFGNPDTWSALQRAGVVTLKADFTHANPTAQALLRQLNPTGGIPLTAIYSPRWDQPLTLDSVYTREALLRAIADAN